MSFLSDAAEEAMKPIKTGVYIGSAVLTVGLLAIAANSGPGRTLLKKIKDSVTSDDVKDKKELPNANSNNKTIERKKSIDVEAEEVQKPKMLNHTKGKSNV